jgi:hypothetical protein
MINSFHNFIFLMDYLITFAMHFKFIEIFINERFILHSFLTLHGRNKITNILFFPFLHMHFVLVATKWGPMWRGLGRWPYIGYKKNLVAIKRNSL